MWPVLDSYKYLCLLVIATIKPICGTALKWILPNKEQHTRFEVLRAVNVKMLSKTLLRIYQPFSVECSSTLNMEAVGSCEKLVRKCSPHYVTSHPTTLCFAFSFKILLFLRCFGSN
jgi:hypothetical protein